MQPRQRELGESKGKLNFKAMTDEITLKIGGLILLVAAREFIMHRRA